ncbi:MAG: type II secretion system protein GspD, partial [Phycisphaerae bacterium]|nr:type II secretion system protein GspD [Gemmatimonadaceae bacterium]
MKTFLRSFVLAGLVAAPLSAQRIPPATAQPPVRGDSSATRSTPSGYVLDFQDQDLRIVLSAVAEAGNLSVTFSNLPTRRVTLRMSKAMTREDAINAMQGLAESNQLRFVQNGEFIRIEGVAQLTPQQLQQQQQQAQAAFAAQNQLQLFTFRLKHVSAVTIAPVLMNLIIGSGQRINVNQNQFNPNTGTQIITIPQAIQPGGGRGGNAGGVGGGGGRGGLELAVQGNAVGAANAQTARFAEQMTAMTESLLGASNANALRQQILQGIGQATGQGQQTQAPAVPGTLSAAVNDIRIVPEESSNSLMIRATAQDFAVIRQIIQTVDLRPLQVLIEVTIAEVARNKDLNAGISGSVGRTRSKDTLSGSLPFAGTARDFVLMLTGGKGTVDYDLAINALQSRGDVKVLSMPVIIAQNNKEAILNVGSQRPFVQVTQTSPLDPTARTQTIQYIDVGKRLTITPTINADGYVNLVVNQTDDNATNEVQFDAPVINKREATTQVFLRNGQTTVIGGLADNDQRNSTSGIPLLSRIPFIGKWLFGSSIQSHYTSELFLFLTPHIISDDADIDRLRDAVKDGSELL